MTCLPSAKPLAGCMASVLPSPAPQQRLPPATLQFSSFHLLSPFRLPSPSSRPPAAAARRRVDVSAQDSRHLAGAAIVEADFLNAQGQQHPEAERESHVGKFVWQQSWYPVGVVGELDKRIPEAVTILGLPMVVWWDRKAGGGQGEWRVFADQCPHRLAPLSEGRIHESGDIQCSYHGWTFDGRGACTLIPQAPKDGPPVNSSPRACARPYPSKVHQGMLWVWPHLGPDAVARAEASPPPLVPQQSDPDFFVNMGQCDLNYGYEFLVENLADPAHVPFAHHKIMGNRANAPLLNFHVTKVTEEGFVGGGQNFRTLTFHAPCLINAIVTIPSKEDQQEKGEMVKSEAVPEVASDATKEKILSMSFYCIPRAPGRSRVIFAFAFNFLPPIARAMPRWLNHVSQMLVLDSDHFFLHLLERRLEDEGGAAHALSAYYAPTKADAFVLAYRRWLNEFAGSSVQWPKGVDPRLPPQLPKEQLLDRQQNHVKICRTCQGAQKGLETLRLVLQVMSFALLAGALVVQAVRPSVRPVLHIAAVIGSALSALAAGWLSRYLQKTYHFNDYVHALVD